MALFSGSGTAAGAFPSLVLAVLSVLPSRAAADAAREFSGAAGRVRIAVIAGTDRAAPAVPALPEGAPADAGPAAAPGAGAPPAADSASAAPGLPADPLGVFAALAGIGRKGEALLQIDLEDRASGRDLRFPLEYSELRRFLRRRPLAYRDGTPEDRVVRMIADLARDLRIEMREPSAPDAKP